MKYLKIVAVALLSATTLLSCKKEEDDCDKYPRFTATETNNWMPYLDKNLLEELYTTGLQQRTIREQLFLNNDTTVVKFYTSGIAYYSYRSGTGVLGGTKVCRNEANLFMSNALLVDSLVDYYRNFWASIRLSKYPGSGDMLEFRSEIGKDPFTRIELSNGKTPNPTLWSGIINGHEYKDLLYIPISPLNSKEIYYSPQFGFVKVVLQNGDKIELIR